MRIYYFMATVSVLLLMACVPSWAGEKKEKEGLQALFMDADLIQDEQLDRGEFDIYHFRSFNRIDADRDGVLLMDECTGDCFTYSIWHGTGPTGSAKNRELAETIREREFVSAPYRFEEIDGNGNGQLSVDEYIIFGRERFQHFDQNKNNMISASEFCSGYRSSMPCDFSDNATAETSTATE